MGVSVDRSANSESGEELGVVIDGQKVFTILNNLPTACALLIGATYELNLAYHKELKYTFEVFQKLTFGSGLFKTFTKAEHLEKQADSLTLLL